MVCTKLVGQLWFVQKLVTMLAPKTSRWNFHEIFLVQVLKCTLKEHCLGAERDNGLIRYTGTRALNTREIRVGLRTRWLIL